MSKSFLFSVIVNSLLGILLLVIAIFISPHASIDIQHHDTYYVISYSTLLIPGGFFVLIKSSITFWYRNKIDYQKTITSFLLLDTIIISALIFFFNQHGAAGVPRRYYRFDGFDTFGSFHNFNPYITILFIILVITQLFFFSILGIDLTKKTLNPIPITPLDSIKN